MSEAIQEPPMVTSFTTLMTEPENAQRWDNAIKVTDLQKQGKPIPENLTAPRVDPEAAEEDAYVESIQTPKPPEVKPAAPEEKPQFKSKKAAEHFENLKRTSQERIDALTAELNAARAGGANKAELDALKAERDQERTLRADYEERLKLLDVERHPQFKKYFDDKMTQVIDMAKEAAGDQGERVAALLRLPDGKYKTDQLNEVAAALGGMEASMLGAALLEYKKIGREREAEVGKYKERHKQMTESQQRAAQENEAQMNALFESQLSALSNPEKGVAMFRPKEGDNAWNAEVAERVALAKAVYRGDLEPQERASIAFWAAAAPKFMAENKTLHAQLAEANKQIAAMKANKPNLGEGSAATEAAPTTIPAGEGFTSPTALASIAQRMATR